MRDLRHLSARTTTQPSSIEEEGYPGQPRAHLAEPGSPSSSMEEG
ncbi:hypothetical protein [Phenylobacterium sp.]|nr:hypothetical protein [Phenylobacterium sp.]HVI33094.1 hypothetical protein [Phenylobacterium sp.]